MSKETDVLLTVEEIAARMHVSAYTVRRWLREGSLKGHNPTRGRWYVTPADLAEFVRRGSNTGSSANGRKQRGG